jgi:hypothetical protein
MLDNGFVVHVGVPSRSEECRIKDLFFDLGMNRQRITYLGRQRLLLGCRPRSLKLRKPLLNLSVVRFQ